ncbi:MAG: FHA domain-containing protein [Deltaproteobacteria bacterium]|nr:FHA domain-containing protein [Deltaproteobacteria bacterium]
MYVALAIVLTAALAVLVMIKKQHVESTPAPEPDPNNKLHWLVADGGDPLRNSWHLGARRVTAGRAASNYMQLTAPGMSRRHAAFYVDVDKVTIVDMSSSNGTRVNGNPVQTARLFDGDVVELAGARFTYRREGNFAANAAWKAKEVGRKVDTTTSMPETMLQLRAQATFQLNGGDVQKTASEVGISVDKLEQLIAAS